MTGLGPYKAHSGVNNKHICQTTTKLAWFSNIFAKQNYIIGDLLAHTIISNQLLFFNFSELPWNLIVKG